ncbi:hypothetical protein Tco_1315988 [Tanacetum coccineum]
MGVTATTCGIPRGTAEPSPPHRACQAIEPSSSLTCDFRAELNPCQAQAWLGLITSLPGATEGETWLITFAKLARSKPDTYPGEADMSKDISGYEGDASGGAKLNQTITKIEAHLPSPRGPCKFALTLALFVGPPSQSA